MNLTFIGHQSWLFSHGDTHVLLDPVLGQSFGHCDRIDFRVYPPRHVDTKQMPKVDAVILSHEHLDHFHLPSLDLLSRDIPFFVGELLPTCVSDPIEKLGFTVKRVPLGVPFQVKDLMLTLFAGARETVFWEKRVTQLLLASVAQPDLSVFVGVDALISTDYSDLVKRGELPQPTAVVVANNSQLPPPGAVGAYSNLLPLPPDRMDARFPGIDLLYSLFIAYLSALPEVPNIILCGNGFVSFHEPFGPFLFSDNKRLAVLANELSMAKGAFGPYPGETLRFEGDNVVQGSSPFIQLDQSLLEELRQRQARFLEAPSPPEFLPVTPLLEAAEVPGAIAHVEAELERMAPALVRSETGVLSLAVNEHLRGPVGPRKMLFRFHESRSGVVHQYALDLARSSFVRDETPAGDVLEVFPFGLDVYLNDFVALIEGRLQIWDLAGNAMRSWFMGSIYQNLVAFLYEYYGEQTRPDLATKVYDGALERLKQSKVVP